MMKKSLALLLLCVATAAFAQDRRQTPQPAPAPAPQAAHETTATKAPDAPQHDQISTTQHTVTINGQPIAYTARAGTMILRDEEGNPRASFFFTSYTRDGADPNRRPITYTFNGGPG